MSISIYNSDDLSFVVFIPSEDFKAYREFIKFRFEIFGREQGWRGLTHPDSLPNTAPEGFYRRGRYLVVRKQGSETLGIGRVLAA